VAGFVASAAGTAIEIAITGLVVPGVVFLAIPLALALLVFVRPGIASFLIATSIAAIFLYGSLAYPLTMERLRHPGDIAPFADAALRTVGLATAFAGSAAALIHHALQPRRT
jgi:hypothetical protein